MATVEPIFEALSGLLEGTTPDESRGAPRFKHNPGIEDAAEILASNHRQFFWDMPSTQDAEDLLTGDAAPAGLLLMAELHVVYFKGDRAPKLRVWGDAEDDAARIAHVLKEVRNAPGAHGSAVRAAGVQGVTIVSSTREWTEPNVIESTLTVIVRYSRTF